MKGKGNSGEGQHGLAYGLAFLNLAHLNNDLTTSVAVFFHLFIGKNREQGEQGLRTGNGTFSVAGNLRTTFILQ